MSRFSKGVFRDCMLVYPGTTVRDFCHQVSPDMEKHMLYAEGADGKRVIWGVCGGV